MADLKKIILKNKTEKVAMKRFLIFLLFLFSVSILYSQENSDAVSDTLITAEATETDVSGVEVEEKKELTEEEVLCKNAADGIMQIYEKWDVSRDYDILMPRIQNYVDGFYNSGYDPDESNRQDLVKLKDIYEKLLVIIESDFERNLIEIELERINKELAGEQKNPALTGYADKMDFDKMNAIEEYLAEQNDPKIAPFIGQIRSIFRNVRRNSIGFDVMLDNIYSEVTRFTDKRFYFLYMESYVKKELNAVSSEIAAYVDSKENDFRKSIQDDIDKIYEQRMEARQLGDADLEKKLYNEWLEARKVNIDRVKTNEISRLTSIINEFLDSPGVYDINENLVYKVKNNTPDLKKYLENILKIKFYHDLNSKFRTYARFAVEKGYRAYRTNVLIGTLMFFILFFYVFTTVKKKRDTIYIRRIPGLDAIDDAVGRATEMGKPIIYDSGIGAFINPQTIASMLILRSVAKKVAEFKAEIIYPAYDPIVLQVAEEMIGSGFLDAGYPEDHKKSNCFFLVQDQFAFAAGLSGLISRRKPATAFHFGSYAAESLLISEAGFAAGAIQVAGTVDASQLPFFITACDYTLIGEELYAAAAYLSRDSQVLSNLKLSDYGKVIFGILFLLGTILLTINSDWTFIVDLLETR